MDENHFQCSIQSQQCQFLAIRFTGGHVLQYGGPMNEGFGQHSWCRQFRDRFRKCDIGIVMEITIESLQMFRLDG